MLFSSWLRNWKGSLERRSAPGQTPRRRSPARRFAPKPRLEVLEDRTLLATFLVTNTGDNGGVDPVPGAATGTLRQAIVDADAAATGTAANPDLIQFNIPTTDPGYNGTTEAFTIQPLSALPTVTDIVVLDGYTQPGASPNTLAIGDNAVLKVVLDGSQLADTSSTGLVIAGGNSTVEGLTVQNFGYDIDLESSSNAVAGDSLQGPTSSQSPLIETFVRCVIVGDGSGNTIGGLAPGARNFISDATTGVGIEIVSPDPGTVVEGNYILTTVTEASGIDLHQTIGVVNSVGVWVVGSSDNTIGGTSANARNVISGWPEEDVRIGGGGNRNVVEGNYIGTDATGSVAQPGPYGPGNGVDIRNGSSGNIIGGSGPGAGNLIAGVVDGVNIATGGPACNNNAIAGNIIAFNSSDGVEIDSGAGNSIQGNSIFSNGSLGIFLNSANNANNDQAFPALTGLSSSNSGTTITGTLQSVANTTFRVEFFSNAAADPSGYGQGQTFLGAVNVPTNGNGAGSFTFTLTTPLPAGQTIVSATATNLTTGDTSQFCQDFSVPSVGPITAPLAPVAVNTAVNVGASFTDAVTSTTHTAVWNWGDGTTSAGTVTETNGSGTVTGSHSYAVDGVYTITLTVTNNVGGSGQSVFQFVVVYNPSAGFVTGGGWFTSPAGADAANPNLTGRANFGLNAKYKSGATVPTGSTEFQFPAGNLNFHATSYDWLVITTNQAQYQGTGTINGAGNYGFLVTTMDNGGTTPDLIRMRIWDKNNNNAVVYDTQPGAPLTALPTTALGGGRIQVHTNAQLVANVASTGRTNPVPLTLAELQPIVHEAIARWGAAGVAPARLRALSQVTVGIADFPGPWLGMAFPGVIWIDRNAAGYGWYIDPTPADDAEFPAAPGGPAYGKVDLLTVVAHELGHELGFDDNAGDGLMGVFLAPGTRRVPAPAHPAGDLGGTVPPAALASVTGALAPAVASPSRPESVAWETGHPNPVPLGSQGTLPAVGEEALNAGRLENTTLRTTQPRSDDRSSTTSLDWYFASLAQDLGRKKSNAGVFTGLL
jgi:hypothetical protein